ncbi:MAG TPA: hypothetical protein VLY21_06325 [Nitrososphaerales archaeon]|nr:hypothetical protein [Nitrososphaerales archaeon]
MSDTGPTPRRGVPNRLLGWFADRADYFAVIIAYVLLTILFTWPLAANFTSFVNGNVMDVFHELWYLHVDYTAPLGPFFLLRTSNILYPVGVPMYFQVMSPLHAIIGAPIYYLFGLVTAYNFLYMFTFAASAFTTYLLVLYLTKNKYAAFFAGIAFGFAPVHTAQATAHLNIMASEMLPLFALFFVKMFKERSERNGIYAGLLLALNAMLDLHFLLLSAIIIVSFLLYYLLASWRSVLNKAFIIRVAIMLGVAACLGVIAFYQTLVGLFFSPASQGALAAATLLGHTHRNPDILQFLLPGPENPILGKYTASIFLNFQTFGQVRTYIGYTVLAMAAVGLAVWKKRREVFLWGFLAVVAFLISLGPNLEFNGQTTPLQGVWTYLYYLVPFFKSFRTPYRIDYDVALAMAVMAGYGIAMIMARLDRGKPGRSWTLTLKKVLVLAIICSFLVVEFLPIPYQEMNAQIPPAYTQILANDHSSYAVLDVPAYVGNDVYLYYSTAYGMPTITGHVSRTPDSSLIFVNAAPFIDQMGQFIKNPRKGTADIFNQSVNIQVLAPYILSQYNIKYVVVHKDLMPFGLYNNTVTFLSSSLGFPIYNDSLTTVFRVDTSSVGLYQYLQASNSTYLGILTGDWNSYGAFGAHARTMAESAGIDIFNQVGRYAQLQFDAKGVTGNYHLQIQVNGVNVGSYLIVNGTYVEYTTPFIFLQQGYNSVVFTSTEGCRAASAGGTATLAPTVTCASVDFHAVDLEFANAS